VANETNLKPFKKKDPRINRNGRPKSSGALRKLAQQIGNEIAKGGGGSPVVIDGRRQTQVTMLLRQMIKENPVKFLEFSFGKPKEETTTEVHLSHSGMTLDAWRKQQEKTRQEIEETLKAFNDSLPDT